MLPDFRHTFPYVNDKPCFVTELIGSQSVIPVHNQRDPGPQPSEWRKYLAVIKYLTG